MKLSMCCSVQGFSRDRHRFSLTKLYQRTGAPSCSLLI